MHVFNLFYQLTNITVRVKAPIDPLCSAPTLDELNQLVVWRVAAQWYEVGVFLEVGAAALDTIRTDNLHNVRQACRDMLREWLSQGPGTGEQPRVLQSVLEAVKVTAGETVAEDISQSENMHTVNGTRFELSKRVAQQGELAQCTVGGDSHCAGFRTCAWLVLSPSSICIQG